jgi:bacteriocin biosynthesis cyclodehydratase domain-containing protein
MLRYRNPRLPSCYYVLCDPPDSAGDEVLRFISERRRITLKGFAFREFHQRVIPLLDGRRSVEEIRSAVSDIFRPQDLDAALDLLAEHRLLEDGPIDATTTDAVAREPQTNFFHAMGVNGQEAQDRLRMASLTVIGLGSIGAPLALAFAAAGIGALRCVDALPVTPADTYLAPTFSPADVGSSRVSVVARRIQAVAPATQVAIDERPLDSDADVVDALRGSDFVVCCLDPAQASLVYKVNRACLAERIRWVSCSATALEVIVGPMVVPGETACYMCYKMRAVACAEDPEADFAFERWLDRQKRDDSQRRENLTMTAAIAANLLGLEVLKLITGVAPLTTSGRLLVFDAIDLSLTRHVILRKPWCPACFPKES